MYYLYKLFTYFNKLLPKPLNIKSLKYISIRKEYT